MCLRPGYRGGMDSEPVVTDWRPVQIRHLARMVNPPRLTMAPLCLAIDGRSASGKTTLAAQLAASMPDSVVVHTDDLAWHEPLFDWAHLLTEAVLLPARKRQPVSFTPPAWRARGREGSIDIPVGTRAIIVEGVGSAHRSTAGMLDAILWVQSDAAVAEARGLARDLASGENGDEQATIDFWEEWIDSERRYLERDRPWERASWFVNGTPNQPPPEGSVLIGQV